MMSMPIYSDEPKQHLAACERVGYRRMTLKLYKGPLRNLMWWNFTI